VETASHESLAEQFEPSASAQSEDVPFPWGFVGCMGLLLLCATFLVISFAWCLKWVGFHTASLLTVWLCEYALAFTALYPVSFVIRAVWLRDIKESKVAITLLMLMPFWISGLHLRGCHTSLKASIAATSGGVVQEAKSDLAKQVVTAVSGRFKEAREGRVKGDQLDIAFAKRSSVRLLSRKCRRDLCRSESTGDGQSVGNQGVGAGWPLGEADRGSTIG
jgi:hypothetical protein